MTGLPLTLDMQAPIEAALSALRRGSAEQCLSERSFSNLYLFRTAHDHRWLPGAWPCISGRTYDGVRHLMPLFPPADAPLDVLRDLLRGHDCLYPLAERDARQLAPGRFSQAASPDDADYLYRAGQFAGYPGRALAHKRSQVRRLHAAHRLEARPFDASQAPARPRASCTRIRSRPAITWPWAPPSSPLAPTPTCSRAPRRRWRRSSARTTPTRPRAAPRPR